MDGVLEMIPIVESNVLHRGRHWKSSFCHKRGLNNSLLLYILALSRISEVCFLGGVGVDGKMKGAVRTTVWVLLLFAGPTSALELPESPLRLMSAAGKERPQFPLSWSASISFCAKDTA